MHIPHDAHEPPARMLSTGTLVLCGQDVSNPNRWALEYRCAACGEVAHRWVPEAFPWVQAALREHGLS